jgi:flagellar basal-body rod protein FlgB
MFGGQAITIGSKLSQGANVQIAPVLSANRRPKQCGWPKGQTMLNRLTDSLNFQAEALSLRSERQRLIASNIANADTPGYVSRDFDFSAALKQATGQASTGQSGIAKGSLPLSTVHGNHLNSQGQMAGSKAEPQMGYATPSQTNLDNNTVDMDRERANFADNTVRYEATLRFINAQVRTLNTAITGQ